MELLAVIAIAVGLAMDTFAVSIVTGAAYKQLHIRHTLRMAGFFGGFQAFMPVVGYLAGLSVRQYVSNYDHWIAFGILAAVGLKMIYESFKIKEERKTPNPANLAVVLVLAVATSIDALAVGITLSLITQCDCAGGYHYRRGNISDCRLPAFISAKNSGISSKAESR